MSIVIPPQLPEPYVPMDREPETRYRKVATWVLLGISIFLNCAPFIAWLLCPKMTNGKFFAAIAVFAAFVMAFFVCAFLAAIPALVAGICARGLGRKIAGFLLAALDLIVAVTGAMFIAFVVWAR